MDKINELLKIRTLYIAIMVIVPTSIHYYNSSEPILTLLIKTLNELGLIVYLLWLYAVSSIGKTKIERFELEVKDSKNVRAYLLLFLLLNLYLFFVEPNSTMYGKLGSFNYYVSSQAPISIISVIIYLYLTYRIAHIIKTIENNRKTKFGDIYTTWFLLIFSWLAIIFLHKKIQNIYGIVKLDR